MKRLFQLAILICMLSLPHLLSAQVFNTEMARKEAKGEGWKGSIDLGFSATKNTKEILQFTNRTDITWSRKKHMLMLMSDLNVLRADKEQLLNKAFGHIRYNYELRPFLIPEAFVQGQYNQIWNLDFRFLVGAGPRFRIHRTDSSRFYVGTLLMYEYEEVTGGVEFNRGLRFSAYVSAGFSLTSVLSMEHITYFQPRVDELSDFRISTDTFFKFSIKKWLAFKTGLSLSYDSRPPTGLDKTFYSFTNSLSFSF